MATENADLDRKMGALGMGANARLDRFWLCLLFAMFKQKIPVRRDNGDALKKFRATDMVNG